MMKRPFLKIERAVGTDRETVRGMMCVSRIQAVQHAFFHVVLVIAICIFEKQKIRPSGNINAAVPEFEAGRILQIAGKGCAFIRAAIVVGIFDDEQLVVSSARSVSSADTCSKQQPKADHACRTTFALVLIAQEIASRRQTN